MVRIDQFRESAYEAAFAELLSTKHLYQSVSVDPLFIEKELASMEGSVIVEGRASPDDSPTGKPRNFVYVKPGIRAIRIKSATLPLEIRTPSNPQPSREHPQEISIAIPNFETWCSVCGERKPFAVIAATGDSHGYPAEALNQATIDQVFHLTCLCQSCQKEHVHFMVRRRVLKLTLVGRSPVEVTSPPPFIPKAVRDFYSSAVIAHNSGQTLAAIFLLRTFIEQFWVHLGLRSENRRISGDELGKRYSQTLPDAIKSSFPSLADHYDLLSARIHEANADSDQFDKSIEAINEHFDARRLFKVSNDRGSCSIASSTPPLSPPDE